MFKKTFIHDISLATRFVWDLFRLYRAQNNNEVAYYNVLFSIAIASEPMTILELGTGPGISSRAFIRALQYFNKIHSTQGFLHTCDVSASTIEPLAKQFGSLVIPHVMLTDDLVKGWVKHATPIDILYIDADHSHEQSLNDFENFASFVIPNGLIIMHDTHPLSVEHEQHKYSGTVYKTAQHIRNNYASEFELMTIPYLCGISLLRKKGSKYF